MSKKLLFGSLFLLTLPVLIAGETEASLSLSGALTVKSGSRVLCTLQPGVFEKDWKEARAKVASYKEMPTESNVRKFKIITPAKAQIDGEASVNAATGKISGQWTFTFATDAELNSLHVGCDFPIHALSGGKWKADDKSGEFPREYKDSILSNTQIQHLEFNYPTGEKLSWDFTVPTTVLLQDSRKWGPSFSIRFGPQGPSKLYKNGEKISVAFSLSSSEKIMLIKDGLTPIQADKNWIPIKQELDIEPGSAVDFSSMNLTDAPAGKHGRVLAQSSSFIFEDSPQTPRKFYGVNLCFTAQYLNSEECERLAERLWRLGYNTVRIHHFEGLLTEGQADSTTLNPKRLEQFDTLLAALKKRGLYLSTDLFVSRRIQWKDIGVTQEGQIPMDTFKILVPVHAKAFENWKSFTRTLLTHKNFLTGLSYAEDPALAWLSLINEGNSGNFLSELHKYPEWTSAWTAWLKKHYETRAKLSEKWGAELKENEDPQTDTVAMPTNIYQASHRTRDVSLFFRDIEIDFYERAKKFIHEELGCKALLSNYNSWIDPLCQQYARQHYDYADTHFYVDHPNFLEKPWSLPSRSPNTLPFKSVAHAGKHNAFLRLIDKPFAVTEFNYSSPSRYRSMAGLMTGALAAFQDWSGMWRFAYSHRRESLFEAQPINYFDMACDPLAQASERAALTLFLRGDMKRGKEVLVVPASEEDWKGATMPWENPDWDWAAWVMRVASQTTASKKSNEPQFIVKIDTKSEDALALIRSKLDAGKNCDPSKTYFQSQTGEWTIDGIQDIVLVDTPRTAGGFAPEGKSIKTENGVSVAVQESDASVWVSALDDQPITKSSRLLLTHITDLQNTDVNYAESARETLLEWGKLPHLVRAGKAQVSLKHAQADKLKVWALALSGKRLGEVPSKAENGVLIFTADVAADAAQTGARMLYEIGLK